MRRKHFKPGILTAIFLVLYGTFRFFAEFFREPDEQLGYVLGMFTMGQMLSLSMLLAGLIMLYMRKRAESKLR